MLNKKKPYGTVVGIPSIPGLLYEQDGKMFDALFREIDCDGNLVGPPNAVPLPDPEPTACEFEPPTAEPAPPPKRYRVHELAKIYELQPPELTRLLKEAGFDIRNHMNFATDEMVEWCRDRLATTYSAPAPKEEEPFPDKPRTFILGGGGQ